MPTHDSLGMTRSRSSHSQHRLDDADIPEIRVKTAYNGQMSITYIDHEISYHAHDRNEGHEWLYQGSGTIFKFLSVG